MMRFFKLSGRDAVRMSTGLCIFLIVILYCWVISFHWEDIEAQWLAYRLESSIVEHARKEPYKMDFTESIEYTEALKKRGKSDVAVHTLCRQIESNNTACQGTAMMLLYFVDKSEARVAIPVLQKVAANEKQLPAIREDAIVTIENLQQKE